MIFYVIKNENELFKLKRNTKDNSSEYEFITKLSESELFKILGNKEYFKFKTVYSKNKDLKNTLFELVMNKRRVEKMFKRREK